MQIFLNEWVQWPCCIQDMAHLSVPCLSSKAGGPSEGPLVARERLMRKKNKHPSSGQAWCPLRSRTENFEKPHFHTFSFFLFFLFCKKKKQSSLLFDKEKRTSTQSSILQGRLGVPWEVGLRSLKKPHSHTFFVSFFCFFFFFFFFLPKKKKQSKAGFCLIGKVGFLSLCTFWGT